MVSVRSTRKPRTSSNPALPRNPSSSPATEQTKSVCWNGMNPPWVWRPWNSPCPSHPPEPIAIRTWRVW
jgi:hypothetical protein